MVGWMTSELENAADGGCQSVHCESDWLVGLVGKRVGFRNHTEFDIVSVMPPAADVASACLWKSFPLAEVAECGGWRMSTNPTFGTAFGGILIIIIILIPIHKTGKRRGKE